MNSGHHCPPHGIVLVQYFKHQCQYLGRGRCSRNDLVRSLDHILIDTGNYHSIDLVLWGSGHENAFGTRFQVFFQFFTLQIATCCINNHINLERVPGDGAGLTARQNTNILPISDKIVTIEPDLILQAAVNRIPYQEIVQGIRMTHVTDGHKVQAGVLVTQTK
ncbi:MAG: hypothetical protein Ct9H300mP9_4960 [Candidatus Neomarinimicrobiota bacterium]|nr:MAG: hypothetical protein Ct9H300mP9_4960 [Candidatus Neomarinimicrobiota bacterium]